MTAPLAVACAVTFVWLGMMLAISFLEAPLKFRAPEVTLRIGLSIGRLVFGALNTVEAVFAATLLVCVIFAPAAAWIMTSTLVAVAILGVQLVLVRPRLAHPRRDTGATLTQSPHLYRPGDRKVHDVDHFRRPVAVDMTRQGNIAYASCSVSPCPPRSRTRHPQ